MKTPDEIKKGLECCHRRNSCRRKCPYDGPSHDIDGCTTKLAGEALAYIQQLETQLTKMWNILRLVTKQKDAAICDMVQIVHEMDDIACKWCKNAYFDEVKCRECRLHNERFEWQGVQPTNTKGDADA